MNDRTPLGFRPFLDGYHDASLQLQMHVYRRSEEQFARWERFKDTLETPEQIKAWQQQLREKAIRALGGLPAGGTPLAPEIVGSLRGEGFRVEKVVFQSLPDVYVTANLYLPERESGARHGAVLFVCGHAELAKAYPFYQAVCQRLARNGLVALAIDPIGQGERKSYLDAHGQELVRWGTREHTFAGIQCWWLGHSIARYFVHDARRAIDYLCSRPEVDPARIGITGNSGGGTQATWLMLLDPRLAAAAPGTFVMRRREYLWTGQAQDAEQIIPGGTQEGIDHEDYLIALAPRPVLVLAADYDFFPLPATLATVERAKRIYRSLGAEDSLGLARARSTHEYHPDLARAATAFFVRHLGHANPAAVNHADPTPFDPAELQCTRSGQVVLDRPQARRVFELNLAEYHALQDQRANATDGNLPERARRWLSEVVQRHRPAITGRGGFFPRWLPGPSGPDAKVMHAFWWSEPDVLNAAVLLRPASGDYVSLLLTLFDQGTSELEARQDWLAARLQAGQAVLALDVRGVGAVRPHQINPNDLDADYGTLFKLVCDLFWLDDSLAAMRIYDVLRAVEFAQEDREIALGGRLIELYGAGQGAFHGYLAAALEPRLRLVELDRPVDLEAVLANRSYPAHPSWQCLLPGLAREVDWQSIPTLFAGRTLTFG